MPLQKLEESTSSRYLPEEREFQASRISSSSRQVMLSPGRTRPVVGRTKKNVWVGLLMLTFAISAFCYTIYLGYANWPYAIEYEGHVLWACVNLAQGHNIYSAASLTQQPYAVIMYNPLFIVIGAGLAKIFGASFLPLRAISIVSTLALLPGFFLLLKRCRLCDFHALIGVVFLATAMPIVYWSNLARVDMLGLAIGVFALERFMAGWTKRGARQSVRPLLLSSLLFVLAFFAKQQYVVFPAAATIFCFLSGSPKLGFKHLASWLLPILSVGAVIELITGGGYLAHLRYGSGLPWEFETLSIFMIPFLLDPKVLAGAVILAAVCFASGRSRPFFRLAAVLIAIAMPLALYTMGLRAAFHNHLLCVYLALAWLVPMCLPRLSPKYTTIALVACLVGTYWCFATNFVVIRNRCSGKLSVTNSAMDYLSKLNLKGKMILSEDPGIALALGATTDLVDSTTIFNICRSKPNGLKPFIDSISSRQYPVIIINASDADKDRERIWTKELTSAIRANYKPTRSLSGNGNTQRIFVLKTTGASSSEHH